MEKTTDNYFIDHCEPPCGLGRFNYQCPECEKWSDDYEVWYKDMELYRGERIEFKCDKCKANLIVFWDTEEGEYNVMKNEI